MTASSGGGFPDWPAGGTRTPRIEGKVKASTLLAYLGSSALLWILDGVGGDPAVIPLLPDALEPLALALLPALVTFVAGWRARHAPRPDLPAAQR